MPVCGTRRAVRPTLSSSAAPDWGVGCGKRRHAVWGGERKMRGPGRGIRKGGGR